MRNTVILDSLNTIKKNSKIIIYSCIYTVIIMLFTIVKYSIFYKIMISGEWKIPNINDTVLYFSASFLLKSSETVILISFVYMIIKNKMRFKRFFSFMTVKNIRYNVLMSLLIIFPMELLNFVLQSKIYGQSAFFSVIISIVYFICIAFGDIMIYFKAANKAEGFGAVFNRTVDFIVNNICPLLVCYTELLIPVQIVTIFLGKCLYPIISEEIFVGALSSVHYGVDIIFVPLYFLCMHNLNNSKKT